METNPLDHFRDQTEPDDLRLARIARQVRTRLDQPAPAPWYQSLIVPALVAIPALSMGLIYLIGTSKAPEAPLTHPELSSPTAMVPDHIPSFPLEDIAPTLLEGTHGNLSLVEKKVALSWNGSGQVSGTTHAPQVDWAAGQVTVEVEPNQGIALSVHTREATIQVVGTGFTVNRDVLGTQVSVLHGRVRVACSGESAVNATLLLEGEARLCMPTTGIGILARARALQTAHADATEVLTTIEHGLVVASGQTVVEDELTVLKLQTLAELNRTEDALLLADRWLVKASQGAGREPEVRRYAASLAMAQGRCEQVVSYLEPLIQPSQIESALVEDIIAHATCVSKNHPEQAREELETAQKLSHTPEQQVAIQAVLSQLGKKD